MATNKQVVEAWTKGKRASTPNKSLKTDGETLWSYNLIIGSTRTYTIRRAPRQYGFVVNEEYTKKIVFDYTSPAGNFVSSTTSTHVGLAKKYADRIEEGV